MKIELSRLNANPFKKKINGGKLNEEQVERLMTNLDKLKLMGALPVVKIKDKYHLVSGHHRVEAMKRKFGPKYEVEVILHNYDDEELFRGMIIENLSQRKGEFVEEKSNVVAMREWLSENPQALQRCRTDTGRHSEKLNKAYQEKVTANDISEWLDKSSEKVISKSKINALLNINDNLPKDMQEEITKGDRNTDEEEKKQIFNVENATIIASLGDDHDEHKKIRKALEDSKGERSWRVRGRRELVSKYKEVRAKAEEGDKKAKEEIELIKEGKKDIALIGVETPKEVNEALKKEEIDIYQAERIAKLKKPEQIKRAIQEHKNLKLVDKHVETSVENITSAKEKREFDKRLAQAGNWITSFRGSVTDSYRSIEKTIKILLISTNFINIMDAKQKSNLDEQLSRFNEILGRAAELTNQVEEKIKDKGGDS